MVYILLNTIHSYTVFIIMHNAINVICTLYAVYYIFNLLQRNKIS